VTETEAADRRTPTVSTGDVYAEHASSLVRFATVLVGRDDAQDVVSAAVLRALDVDWGLVTNRSLIEFSFMPFVTLT
jgi:DNA-directed RNA polymerase specialized sigma24 family protein